MIMTSSVVRCNISVTNGAKYWVWALICGQQGLWHWRCAPNSSPCQWMHHHYETRPEPPPPSSSTTTTTVTSSLLNPGFHQRWLCFEPGRFHHAECIYEFMSNGLWLCRFCVWNMETTNVRVQQCFVIVCKVRKCLFITSFENYFYCSTLLINYEILVFMK